MKGSRVISDSIICTLYHPKCQLDEYQKKYLAGTGKCCSGAKVVAVVCDIASDNKHSHSSSAEDQLHGCVV